MKNKAPSTSPQAFSLVELLVVISVIAIIAGFAVPAVTTMIRGSQLSQGSQMLSDQLSLARQTALSKNHQVEVRFYKFGDPETPGESPDKPETGVFRAMQIFDVLENGVAVPLGPIQRLPVNVVINETKLSTLLDKNQRTRVLKDVVQKDQTAPEMPDSTVKKNYEYVAMRFLPDGSTDLSANGTSASEGILKGDAWYLTMHGSVVKGGGQTTTLPDNYFILQIDPVTGTTRPFRRNL